MYETLSVERLPDRGGWEPGAAFRFRANNGDRGVGEWVTAARSADTKTCRLPHFPPLVSSIPLIWSQCLHREGVDLGLHLFRERLVDEALRFNDGETLEARRHDGRAKMPPARGSTRVAGVQVTLVHHVHVHGVQRLAESHLDAKATLRRVCVCTRIAHSAEPINPSEDPGSARR